MRDIGVLAEGYPRRSARWSRQGDDEQPLYWKNWSSERIGVTLPSSRHSASRSRPFSSSWPYAVPQAVPVDAVTLLSLRMLFRCRFSAGSPSSQAVRCRRSAGVTGWCLPCSHARLLRREYLRLYRLKYISAGLERLILFTYPTLTLLIGVLFMGRAIKPQEVGALLLSYAGIGLAFVHDLNFGGATSMVVIGGLFVFASSLTYSIYLTGSTPMIQRLGSVRFTAWVMLIRRWPTEIHFFSANSISALVQPLSIYVYGAAMAIFSTIAPIFMLSAAIRRIGPSTPY